MNNLSLEQLERHPDSGDFEKRLASLPKRQRAEVLQRALKWGVERGLDGLTRDYGPALADMGQDELNVLISGAIERAIKPMIPTLQKHLLEAAEPAAQKAADVIGPVVEKKLKEQIPKFAIITGIVAAGLAVLGMLAVGGFVVKRIG